MAYYDEEPEDYPGYRNGIRIETEFRENAFGIDPEDCGCTDCLVGNSFNAGSYRIEEAIRQGRILINRTGREVILPNGYRLGSHETWRPGMVQHHCPGCNCQRF